MKTRKSILSVSIFSILMSSLFAFMGTSDLNGQFPGIVTERPPSLEVNPDFDRGLLNVTYYGAIPDDGIDDSDQLQKALNDARDYCLICYLPNGVYNISKTLYGRMLDSDQDRQFRPTMLIGEKEGDRPVIKVEDGSLQDRYPALWFYGDPNGSGWDVTELGLTEQPNASYHHIIKNIEIDMGNNPEGVGIHFKGAQGCSMEDLKIYSAQGIDYFAGINGGLSHAGGMFNIEIVGGEYGIYGSDETRFSFGGGIILKNQTTASILWEPTCPLTLAGFYIEKENGPVFRSASGGERLGNVKLIDGVVNITNSSVQPAVDNTLNKDVYLREVYVKGAKTLVAEPSWSWTTQNSDTWTLIEEYSYANNSSLNIIDGGATNSNEYRFKAENVEAPDINEILTKYSWEPGTIPDFEDPDIVNVVTQYGAKGDDSFDNAPALQKAIDENPGKKIYLPKGIYQIGKTIVLGKDTKLFGLSSTMTYLKPSYSFSASAVEGTPMLQTVDDADAETYLGDIAVYVPGYQSKVSMLTWRAGRKSMVRRLVPFTTGSTQTTQNSAIVITGNGGGRWYGIYLAKMVPYTGSVNSRLLLIDSTHEPLSMISPNPEHVKLSRWAMEIRNSKNVQMFNLKGESGTFNSGKIPLLGIINSENVSIYSVSNVGTLDKGGLIEIENSRNYLVNFVKTSVQSTAYSVVVDKYGETTRTVPATKVVQLVKRGDSQLLDHGMTDPTTDISEEQTFSDRWIVYPNPAEDYIMVKTDLELPDKTSIKLFDIMGRFHAEQKMSSKELRFEIPGTPAGVYFLQLTYDSQEPEAFMFVKK